MKQLIEEIRTHFASQVQGIRMLKCLPADYKAYSFRQGVEYGVAIETTISKEVYEEAAQITIKTFNNLGVKYIALSCCDEAFRNEFAKFGVFFILPGDNGEIRTSILTSPLKWWKGWIGMLGNRIGEMRTYDTIAELLMLDYLYQKDKTTIWTAKEAGTHDIESDTNSYEVKSTIKKTETTITISSQHQLSSTNPLNLVFFRMEKSLSGYSINNVVRSLITHGYDKNLLESQLESKGFVLGKSIRDIKYAILEIRKFKVTDKFPKIVEKSFKNNAFPKNIIKLLYTIDLEGLDYVPMSFVKTTNGTIEGVMDAKNNNSNCEDHEIDNFR